MKMRPAIRSIAMLATAIALDVSASPVTYDLVADWNPPNNPNAPWSYRSGSAVLPYQNTIPAAGGSGGYAPSSAGGSYLPLFWQPGGAGTDILVHSNDSANGGAASGEAIVVWTAPNAGIFDVSGYFYYDHAGVVRSNDISVSHNKSNGALVSQLLDDFTSTVIHPDFSRRAIFSFDDMNFSAGDELRIKIAKTSGQAFGSITALNLRVTNDGTSVPAPGAPTTMLLALAAALIASCRRRRVA